MKTLHAFAAALLPHSKKVLGSILGLGPICVQFACPKSACVSSHTQKNMLVVAPAIAAALIDSSEPIISTMTIKIRHELVFLVKYHKSSSKN